MFKLLVAIVLLSAGGQVETLQHRDLFESLQVCEAAAERDLPGLRTVLDAQLGPENYLIGHRCEQVKQSSNVQDRAADEISAVLRAMIRRGGIGAVRVQP